ncbi:MAG: M20/M25/M40 family metallo-hydrolase [candidate division Zixibacteria bacterium]|nr:M20/M25/M40 family metallo-hydrolase [candidate division Zixibacteria bacterium]
MRAVSIALVILAFVFTASAFAENSYFIVVDASGSFEQSSLNGYPGKYYGKSGDFIFLYGNDDNLCWLGERAIPVEFRTIGEPRQLFLVYGSQKTNVNESPETLFSNGDCFVTLRLPDNYTFYRKLTLNSYPDNIQTESPEILLEFDPVVNQMIEQVNIDTLEILLRGLSGEEEVTIGGQPYTIDTRYSGTEGNSMAAQWLMEILERYGYQVEYHSFYSGQGRHTTAYDQNRMWLVAQNSEALRTTDGGQTWNVMEINTSEDLWGIENIGPDSVWITGDRGTIRFSSDGGETFASQSAGSSAFLFGLCFINSQEGWIARDNGRILHTSNAGQSWLTQTTPTGSRLYDVCFADSDNGWACGRDGTIIHTSDGGSNWETQSSGTNQRLYSIDFINANTGWAVGWGGVVLKTTNGGDNWTDVDIGSMAEKYHVDFSDAMHGCIVGWYGEIFTTADGGDNWTQRDIGTAKDFYGVEFADNMNGIACGDGIIMTTSDGGETWNNASGGVENALDNVVATLPGSVTPDEQVIICGHFDSISEQPTVRAPGADDNGSGTLAVIEAARIFRNYSFDRTIKFCLWNGEEQGLLGSAAYAADAFNAGDDIVGVYNFDMIAWDGNDDRVAELHVGTMSSSQVIGDLFEEVLDDYSIDLNTEYLTWGATDRSDHASFWQYNYPAILGIEDFTGDFHPYYHTTNDNIDYINWDYFHIYSRAAIGATATLAHPEYLDVDEENNPALPYSIDAVSNYPNPFNAATNITFELAHKSNVKIEIFNIYGQKIEKILDSEISSGIHTINWDAADYASGVYFYRISTSEQSLTKRMTLVK